MTDTAGVDLDQDLAYMRLVNGHFFNDELLACCLADGGLASLGDVKSHSCLIFNWFSVGRR